METPLGNVATAETVREANLLLTGGSMSRALPKELLIIPIVMVGLLAAELVSRLLAWYLAVPLARGIAYLIVSLLILFLFRRGSRLSIFVSLGLCLLVGLLAFFGT